MPHTYSNLLVHVIFSTQERKPAITPDIQSQLFAYMGGIVRTLHGRALAIGGTKDHVHMLMRLPQDACVADMVRVVKSNSSRWMHEKWAASASFSWQTGYGAFSVSKSNASAVAKYIAEQSRHHSHRSFQEEFVAFLRKNGVEYDERYIWG